MADFAIRKAEKKRRRLRLALIGVSKSGKTLTALKFARALVGPEGRIGLVDTEGGNSEIYAGEKDVGEFGIIALEAFSPETYIEAMHALVRAGCAAIVIDSLSHAWMGRGGVLEIVDGAGGSSKFTSGWGKATPLHNDLISAINHCPVHVIATMRQKADYVLETVEKNGKTIQQPKKVGMAAVQREGMEYEFDITGTMHEAVLTVDGIRGTALESYLGKAFKKPGAEFIEKIRSNLDDSPYTPPAPPAPPVASPAPTPAPTPAAPVHHNGTLNGTSNGTSNGHHTTGPSTPPRDVPVSPKAKLWSEIRAWSGVHTTDLADAARRIYAHLGIPTNGKASDAEIGKALDYVQIMLMEHASFDEWASDPKKSDRKHAKAVGGLVPVEPDFTVDGKINAGPVLVRDAEPINEEDIPF